MESLDLLGVRVCSVNRSQLLETAVNWAQQRQPRTLMYVNAHCLNQAWNDPSLRQVLNAADLVYSDGIGVVWASRILGGPRLYKVTGRAWIDAFCQRSVAAGLRVFILGGRSTVAQRAAANLHARWPGLQITGVASGYFDPGSELQVLEQISRAAPHVLFIGMGTPRQETWIAQVRQQIQAPVCWVVGALFDYIAGVEPRVPAFMDKLALEWLWRLLINPRGKWRRYLLGNPLFIWRVLRQRLGTG